VGAREHHRPAAKATPQQIPASGPKIWLQDAHTLQVTHVGKTTGAARSAQYLAAGQGTPLSMINGDFDEDGVEDLVVGYATPAGGAIVLHRGNLDAFAPQSEASFQAIGRGQFPSPFVAQAQVIDVQVRPDFIAAGNFVEHGNLDLVVASRGGNTLYILPGDGKGGFGAPQAVSVQGAVTAMAAGSLGAAHGLTDLVLGLSNAGKSSLLILSDTGLGLGALANFPLAGPASNILFGEFGESGQDVAFLSGGQVQILRAARMEVTAVSLPVTVRAFALGSFIYDRNPGVQIAVVTENGSIEIAAQNKFDPRSYSQDEWSVIKRGAKVRTEPNPLLPPKSFPSNGWQVVESFPGVASLPAGQNTVFFRTRVSSGGMDDVMLLDPLSGQLALISHPDVPAGASTFLPGQLSLRQYSGTVTTALPMRINVDGRPGVVAIHQGEIAPSMLMPLPDPTFFPNRFDDISPRGTSVTCLNTTGVDGSGDCTLREAIIKANATVGTDTIMLQAGTYTLTLARIGADHHTSLQGTLEVQDSLNIIGAGQATTIIQGGTNLVTSVDKVISFNQDIDSFTNATVSVSNLTIQNGNNKGDAFGFQDGFGGAFDFDTGTSGNNTLTMTNVTIQNSKVSDGQGGGFTIFNTMNGTGFATFTNCIVQNNVGVPNSSDSLGDGGGIVIDARSKIVLSNVVVINNQAQSNAGKNATGGGMFFQGQHTQPQSHISGSTIANNTASGIGGGMNTIATLLIDGGTIIANNIAGKDANNFGGGGIRNDSFDGLTISKVAIRGNTTTGNGGAIFTGDGSGNNPVTISFSRLAGNTSTLNAGGDNLFNFTSATPTAPAFGNLITARNNWWGTNNPASTIISPSTACPVATHSDDVCFDPFIVLVHTASPNKIRINQNATLTADMSQDNHGSGAMLSGNLDEIIGLPVNFNNAILGSIPQTQPETLGNPVPVATATFNAGGIGGNGSADATVDQQTVTASIIVLQPPSISATFGPKTIQTTAGTGTKVSTITFSIVNPNTVAINASFTDTLPTGVGTVPGSLVVAGTPNIVNGCGGTASATAGSGSISFTNASLAVGTCTVKVDVQSAVDNIYSNSVTINSTDAGNGNTATDTLTVINPPHAAKSFGAVSLPFGATTSLTITVSNPNQNQTINGISYTDTLPTAAPGTLVVVMSNGFTSTCTGAAVVSTSSGSVSLSSARLAPGGFCGVTASVQGTGVGAANNSVTASDSAAGTGNTATASLTVVKADTSTAVTSSVNPSVFGQAVTFTATLSAVAPGAGTATGTVTFLDGGSPIGTGTLSGGVATFTTTALSVGSHTITTSYGGDTNFNGSTGTLASNPQIVNKTDTATAIASSANPSVFGQSVTFTATVSPVAPGAGTATGTVMFLDGGTPIGTGTLSGGVANLVTSALATGNHTITTSYGGDGNFNGSTGSLTGNPQVVSKANSATAVTSSQNPSNFGQSVTFTATVVAVAPGAGTATGTVTFLDGGSSIGNGTLSGGVATFVTSALATGNHTITTSYGGDGNFSGSTAALTGNPQVVNKANSATAVTSSQNPSNFGQSVTFTATVSPVAPGTGTATGTVMFLDGGSPIGTGTLSAGVATFLTSALVSGNHTITTSYVGDGNFNGSTGSLAGNPQVVSKTNSATTVTSSQNPSNFGQSVTFTATVAPVAPGAGTPTGTVTFLDGGSPIGTGTLSAGVATFATSTLATGNHTITTSYAGDGNFNGSTGSLAGNPQVVNKNSSTTVVTSSQNPSALGQSVTFTATISPVAPGTGAPTGTVTFLDGGSPIGTGTLSGGVATLATSALSLGNHTITTSYGGDGNFNGSTGALTGNPQVVNKDSSTTAVTSSQNPSALGQSVTFTATVSPVAPAASTPTGTVTFLDGGSSIGTGTLSGGVATFTTSALAAGNHIITAGYSGDANFGGTGGTASVSETVVAPPAIAKTFNPTTIAPNGVSTLSITVGNPAANTVAETGVAFSDALPAGIVVATPNGLTNTCGGAATATAGSGSVTLTGGAVAVNSSCTFSVNITASAAGQYLNSTGPVSSTNGGTGGGASATLLVANAPVIAKSFGAALIPLNSSTSLTFAIQNSNASLAVTGLAFTDTLPAGMVVATPSGATDTCGGAVTAVAGTGSVTLASGSLAANSTCAVALNVTGVTSGVKNNSVTVTSTNAGTGNTANASLTVVSPPVIAKAFGPASVPLNGSSSLSFTINNPNATQALAGVAFTDTFPSGLVVATPNGLTGTCGAGTIAAAAGANAISLSGATLAASGSCTFSINATGTAVGQQNNTTGAVTATQSGAGGTASASLTVVGPPSIAKAFNPASIVPGGTSTLTITVANPASNTVGQAGVAFSDTFPAGLVVATPNGLTNNCGGTATSTAGSGSVSLTGGSVAASSSCVISVNVTAATGGQYVNTTGAVSSTNGGTGNTASATLLAGMPPAIAKAFGASSIGLAGSTSLTFTINNPNSALAYTGVAFTDALPAGLVVSTPNGLTGTCGTGAITAAAGSQTVSLTGGTIALSSSCSFSVNVTGVAAGAQLNTTGAVSATNAGTGNTATASITVLAPDLAIAKSHTGNFFQGQSGATYTVVANNAGQGPTAGTVTVTEIPPAGLTVTALAGTGWTCSVGALSCTRADALAAGSSYPAITVTVSVAASAPATVTNVVTVAGGGELNLANDSASDTTTVTPPPDFSLAVAPPSILVHAGLTANYALTVSPLNNAFANSIAFTVTGLPNKSSFSFTPVAVTLGANPATSTLLIGTSAGDPFLARNAEKPRLPLYAMFLPVAGLLLSGAGFRKKVWRKGKGAWLFFAFLLVCTGVAMNGCATARNIKNLGTTPGTYTVTVTATSGNIQHSASATLVVVP
jgi:hypothetical protein